MEKLLLVDDDVVTREVLTKALSLHDFEVTCACNGEQALLLLEQHTPDVIILDVDMPYMDGFSFLRERNDALPVILISVTDDESLRIKGFELGADDFLAKPFSAKELSVRIAALKRRIDIVKAEQEFNQPSLTANILFDEQDFSVEFDKHRVLLTQTEFNLFKYLFDRKGEVISKSELQLSVLKKELGKFDRNLDMHISNTRKKLASTEIPKTVINTVRGKGYSFSFN